MFLGVSEIPGAPELDKQKDKQVGSPGTREVKTLEVLRAQAIKEQWLT